MLEIFYLFFFFLNDTATTEIYTRPYTLSLHDALPISYRNLGPAAYSGRVTSLAVPRGTPYPKTMCLGAAGGGVWKTVNGGITWQSASEGLGVQTIGDLAVAPSDSGVLWVGTGEKNSLRSQWWG